MKYSELFGLTLTDAPSDNSTLLLDQIAALSSCTDFLKQSNGQPLIKELQNVRSFRKLKARHRNKSFSSLLNDAFNSSIGTRCITTASTVDELTDHHYYVFPINGFKFLYDPTGTPVTSYQSLTKTVQTELVEELMRLNIEGSDLTQALSIGTEVVLYDIPYCYAVNVKTVSDYNNLLSLL